MIHINLCVASCDVLTVTINRKQQRALGNNVIIYIVCHSSCDSDSVAYRSHKPRRSPARPLLYAILIYAYPRASKHRDLQTLRFCSLSWEVLDVSLAVCCCCCCCCIQQNIFMLNGCALQRTNIYSYALMIWFWLFLQCLLLCYINTQMLGRNSEFMCSIGRPQKERTLIFLFVLFLFYYECWKMGKKEI